MVVIVFRRLSIVESLGERPCDVRSCLASAVSDAIVHIRRQPYSPTGTVSVVYIASSNRIKIAFTSYLGVFFLFGRQRHSRTLVNFARCELDERCSRRVSHFVLLLNLSTGTDWNLQTSDQRNIGRVVFSLAATFFSTLYIIYTLYHSRLLRTLSYLVFNAEQTEFLLRSACSFRRKVNCAESASC